MEANTSNVEKNFLNKLNENNSEANTPKIETNSINKIKENNSESKSDGLTKNESKNEYFSLNKKEFKVDEIIENCKEKDGIELLNYMCTVMHEKKRNILESLYKELGKDFLIAILEKALNIENNGGLEKGKSIYAKKKQEKKGNEKILVPNNTSEKKSIGGIFFGLIKKDPQGNIILKKATKLDYKESRQRKKVYKLMDKLNI